MSERSLTSLIRGYEAQAACPATPAALRECAAAFARILTDVRERVDGIVSEVEGTECSYALLHLLDLIGEEGDTNE